MHPEFLQDFPSPGRVVDTLQDIQRWLEIDPANAVSFKERSEFIQLAPSIVTRGDSLVLGASAPRFSRLCFLSKDKESFMNLRRKKRLEKLLPKKWARVPLGFEEESLPSEDGNERFEQVEIDGNPKNFFKGGVIGDSVLAVSDRRLAEFDMVTTDLHPLYGQAEDFSNRRHNVSFLRQYKLSGCCADASLFMASCLLHGHASKLFGLSELASLRHPSPKYFSNEASDWSGIVESAKALGLNVSPQGLRKTNLGPRQSEQALLEAIGSYVRSGIPVLYPVNFRHLQRVIDRHGDDLRWTFSDGPDGRKPDSPPAAKESSKESDSDDIPLPEGEAHIVVIIGVKKGSEDRFLVLDSGSMPFLELSRKELLECAVRVVPPAPDSRGPKRKEDSQLDDPQDNEILVPDVTGQIAIGPVTPKGVTVTLLPRLPDFQGSRVSSDPPNVRLALGDLRSLTDHRLRKLMSAAGGPATVSAEIRTRLRRGLVPRARLVMTEDLIKAMRGKELSQHPKIRRLSAATHPMLWLQQVGGEIFLWAAGLQGMGNYAADELFLGSVQIKGTLIDGISGLDFRKMSRVFPRVHSEEWFSNTSFDSESSPINPSIVTSFSEGGLEKNILQLPPQCSFVEVYCFMQEDVPDFFETEDDITVLEAMAIAYRSNPGLIPRVADKISKILAKKTSSHGQVSITGLASYIPEITSGDRELYEKAIDALCFLYRLAEDLRYSHGNDCLRFVEIVAGNLVESCWIWKRKDDADDEGFLAMARQKPEDAAKLFKDAMMKVEEEMGIRKDSDIHFALEIEPGPLFCCKSLGIAEKLLIGDDRQNFCKLNLDFAHNVILGGNVDPSCLKALKDSIVNVHVSDHSIGHFADLGLFTLTSGTVYQSWFKYLFKGGDFEDGSGPARFFRSASLEVELKNNPTHVADSYDNMCSVIYNACMS